MRKSLLLLLFISSTLVGYSQVYSYSFEGELTPENITSLQQKCMEISTVNSAKIYYKEESYKGEIILQLKREEIKENEEQFNPATVKAILLEAQLSPLQYRKLND